MIDDALELATEAFASAVGWRARRKERAAELARMAPPLPGEFDLVEVGRLRSRPAGRIAVHGDTVRWAGPGTDVSGDPADEADPGVREVAAPEVRFRVEPSTQDAGDTRVWLSLPGARPLTVTVGPAHQGSVRCAELVDLLRAAGAVEEPF